MNLGVNIPHCIHHTPDQQMALAAAAKELGVDYVRIAIPWPDVEPEQGPYDWQKADYTVDLFDRLGLAVLPILWGFPGWANGGKPANVATFATPLGFSAWRGYIHQVTTRYEFEYVEVGNEPNIHGFMSPPDPIHYAKLVQSAYYVSLSKIVAGAVAGCDLTFLRSCFANKMLDYCDVISYHPYPETLYPSLEPTIDAGWWIFRTRQPRDSFAALTKLVKEYGSAPIWATEVGWTTAGWASVNEHQQAEYVGRSVAEYRKLGLDSYCYFQLWDEYPPGSWWVGREAGFGLLRYDFGRKPAFGIYR